MATLFESLAAVNAYPIPPRTIADTAARQGLDPQAEATQETMHSAAYRLAQADLLLWLSLAPDVAQGGQSYSFTDEQHTSLRARANAIYGECEAAEKRPKTLYGYKGSRL